LFDHKPKLTGREINMWEHKGWGNAINWLDFEKRKMYGHLYDKPRIGDLINCQMQSGKVHSFIVVDVEYKSDPPDMFFCDVSDYKYKEPNA
jgi:hypothetical protein